jgi:hypothetical protein
MKNKEIFIYIDKRIIMNSKISVKVENFKLHFLINYSMEF